MDEKNLTRQIKVRPSKPGAIVFIIIGVVFFVFGTVLTGAGLADSDDPALTMLLYLFRVIWWLVCLGMVVFGVLTLVRKKPPAMMQVDIGRADAKEDFETRLRKLEKLKKDGLISEHEYIQKRAEIMNEKW